ncbi:hypothetical protein PAXINDRAFT_102176 [Paxillus involutus ATCC 200175]|uniref:Uncharacterized protein n=1 Tax=Paxillus involutus ATCC 200175 TaxID=664439 RepID=A0A0C9TG06_PAXIN|nr:hypothetical protein PAXINDRAFT_102176 [Paxillus involutus ATCC 200175]
MAESIHLNYGRLPPRALNERVENMGYATFAILIAMLYLSMVIVRVAGIFSVRFSRASDVSHMLQCSTVYHPSAPYTPCEDLQDNDSQAD